MKYIPILTENLQPKIFTKQGVLIWWNWPIKGVTGHKPGGHKCKIYLQLTTHWRIDAFVK